jgi:cellulose synthase/poly-beta-1,6-N-acetylglucosamine synthase-like glycosyltransferase
MGIIELRQLGAADPYVADTATELEADLIRRGAISPTDVAHARTVQKNCDASIDRILLAEGLTSQQTLLDAHARTCKSRQLGESDLELLSYVQTDIDPALLLKHAVLPILDRDGLPALVVEDPRSIARLSDVLPDELNRARLLLAPRDVIQNRIAAFNRPALEQTAFARVAESESCRSWATAKGRRIGLTIATFAALIAGTWAYPDLVFAGFAIWAIFTLIVSAIFKTAAFVAHRMAEPDRSGTPGSGDAPLPKVSILVPLYKETEVLHALVARLSRLTYPKCLLDVLLVIEEADDVTRDMLAKIDLPPWARPVVVPDGQPRTKPRAMNYALDFCEGDIIGVYDAEDAPEPDQITQVARRFQVLPPEVACIQGVLDYYNPRQNWLARCFTIEYATWFRLILPGMSRLGLAIPLGGTTLFFRRAALEKLGGWDAHNVTEDADLGFRLARHGYRTDMLSTVTEEEANCLPWAWIRQRSRWLKGYMTTYIVHMRRPLLLLRQLGAWKFLGFQAHFVTALSQFLLAPLLWSFWLVLVGLPHPLDPFVSKPLMIGLGSAFLVIEVINITIYASAVADARHRHLLPWTPTMHFYTPLGAIAAYKALYELVVKPFFWDKTRHGLSLITPKDRSLVFKRSGREIR